jgi:uncharacterized membrane protein YhiD involved in acid resistance
MSNTIFNGIFDKEGASVISIGDFLLCLGAALVIGLILAFAYMWRNRYSSSFVLSLATIPAVVCIVIMMVNGNIGAGVAVAGAFSLVRFRSVPGSAREIGSLFLAMGTGLMVGMGYIGYALLFALIISGINILYTALGLGKSKKTKADRTLRVTIPEDLNYTEVFDDILNEYAANTELIQVKTTNMGSMFRLTYNLTLKDVTKEKELINKLRCHNGNLEIIISRQEAPAPEL